MNNKIKRILTKYEALCMFIWASLRARVGNDERVGKITKGVEIDETDERVGI